MQAAAAPIIIKSNFTGSRRLFGRFWFPPAITIHLNRIFKSEHSHKKLHRGYQIFRGGNPRWQFLIKIQIKNLLSPGLDFDEPANSRSPVFREFIEFKLHITLRPLQVHPSMPSAWVHDLPSTNSHRHLVFDDGIIEIYGFWYCYSTSRALARTVNSVRYHGKINMFYTNTNGPSLLAPASRSLALRV